jgi:hypothetical protein
MFRSNLIEKLLNDTSIRVQEKEKHFEISSIEQGPIFFVQKENLSIHLVFDITELVASKDETVCCEILVTYLKLNYLAQNGFLSLFLQDNISKLEALNVKKVQNCLSFFEELKGEKKSNLNELHLNTIRIHEKQMHESFIRL